MAWLPVPRAHTPLRVERCTSCGRGSACSLCVVCVCVCEREPWLVNTFDVLFAPGRGVGSDWVEVMLVVEEVRVGYRARQHRVGCACRLRGSLALALVHAVLTGVEVRVDHVLRHGTKGAGDGRSSDGW